MYPTINGILGLEQIIAAAANSELVPNQGRGLVHRKLVEAPPPPPPPPPQQFYCWPSQGGSSVFGSLVILDVVCRYLSLSLLYINIKIGTNRC